MTTNTNMREALDSIAFELAALIEKPYAPTVEQWPCENAADRECLQKAYLAAKSALAYRPDAQADERGAFEECIREHSDPDRFDDLIARDGEHYVEYATALAWAAWQARAAAAPQAEAAQGVILDVEIRPIVMAGSPNACQVWLRHANGQQFAVGNPHETRADGEWFADQLRKALFAPSPDHEQVGGASEAARIVKMWDDGFTQLAGKRAVELLRDASSSRECDERQGTALSDSQILEIGYRHFKPGHNVKAEANFVAAVRDVLAASAPTLGEPGPSCDSGDICAGCRCRYNKYIDGAPAVARTGLTDEQRASIRNEALRGAAAVCDKKKKELNDDEHFAQAIGARLCAQDIRALLAKGE